MGPVHIHISTAGVLTCPNTSAWHLAALSHKAQVRTLPPALSLPSVGGPRSPSGVCGLLLRGFLRCRPVPVRPAERVCDLFRCTCCRRNARSGRVCCLLHQRHGGSTAPHVQGAPWVGVSSLARLRRPVHGSPAGSSPPPCLPLPWGPGPGLPRPREVSTHPSALTARGRTRTGNVLLTARGRTRGDGMKGRSPLSASGAECPAASRVDAGIRVVLSSGQFTDMTQSGWLSLFILTLIVVSVPVSLGPPVWSLTRGGPGSFRARPPCASPKGELSKQRWGVRVVTD